MRARFELQPNGRPHKILCCREIQNSIRDSVLSLLKEKIEELGFQKFFRVTDKEIRGKNGSQFIFAGLHQNLTSIKSIPGVSICWVEEAATVSKASWDILVPTVSRNAGAQIYVTFNPDLPTDPASQMFIEKKVPNANVVECTFEDNPWQTDETRRIRAHAYKVDPDAAAHVWGGHYRRNSLAQIFGPITLDDDTKRRRYSVQAFEVESDWHGPYFGADWGFSVDPTTLIKSWLSLDKRKLYIEHEAYRIGVENGHPDSRQHAKRIDKSDPRPWTIGELFETVPQALYRHTHRPICKVDTEGVCQFKLKNGDVLEQQHLIIADNARPETINHAAKIGFNIVKCEKWPGSVEDGIAFLRNFDEIIIHPRCTNTANEFLTYSFKVDKLGNITLVPEDRNNHCIDPIRYSLQSEIATFETDGIVTYEEDVSVAPELDEWEASQW